MPAKGMAKYQEIELGARICRVIRNSLYIDKPWIECHKLIAMRFTMLKQLSRKQYADKTEIEMLQWLGKYSEDDIRDFVV